MYLHNRYTVRQELLSLPVDAAPTTTLYYRKTSSVSGHVIVIKRPICMGETLIDTLELY